jgi:cell pole-organizing protein PopZ
MNNRPSDMSIDEILVSIQNVINKRSAEGYISEDNIEEELELTEVVISEESKPEISSSILSEETYNRAKATLEDFAETACSLGRTITSENSSDHQQEKTIEKFLMDILKPQMKDWLDCNLPIIVKQVVSEEIKKLVADMNKGSKI